MSLYKWKKGGADLRDYYLLHLQAGLIVTLILFIFLFRINLSMSSEFRVSHIEPEIIEMEEIVRTEQIVRPPPPPRPPAPRMVPNEEIVEEMYFDLGTDFVIDEELVISPPPGMPEEEEDEFDAFEIFTIVEEMPVLLGGMSAVYKNLRYPEIARKAGIEGRVIVQFIIDEEGNVTEPYIVRGIGGGCDEAALEAVSQLQFSPGRQRGRPVRVRYSLPIMFRLAS